MNSNFATTQWTLVWKAAAEDDQHGRPALAEVIRRYWQPLYSFARRRGLTSEDAEDATQEFLSRVLDGHLLSHADPAKGKFRSYLLTAWKRFLVDEYRKGQAARRGGHRQTASCDAAKSGARQLDALHPGPVRIDVARGESTWLELKSREPDPERLFMRSWANSLLDEVQQRLRCSYQTMNRSRIFDALLPKLTMSLDARAYAQLASELDSSTSAVKVALHRLRQRYGQTLREVILETVEDPGDVEGEIQELLEVLRD